MINENVLSILFEVIFFIHSFTIILGDVKPSHPQNTEQVFMFHLDVQVSQTTLIYTFHEGTMQNSPMVET